jgi:DNA-binding NarL/FixJ family response regulator
MHNSLHRSGDGGSQDLTRALLAQPVLPPLRRRVARFRIFVVEDNLFVRESLVRLLGSQPDLSCCGESDSALTAPFLIAEQQPDLILADLRLKHGEAFDLLVTLRELRIGTPVLILSQADESIYAAKALAAGARGYLMKQEAPQELFDAIHQVLQGSFYLSRNLRAQFRQDFSGAL